MEFGYSKAEKLKSRKIIESLFAEGKSVGVYPLRLFYIELPDTETAQVKTAVSVSKKNFRGAVQRNYIKRLLRETYRLNKHLVYRDGSKKYALLFLYVGREKPSFHLLDEVMKKLMKKFAGQNET